MKTIAESLRRLIEQQSDVVTRGQVLAHGTTQTELTGLISRRGPWRRLLPGVYVTHTGPPTAHQRLTAALLFAGDEAMLTGLEALRRHRVRGRYQDGRIDVLVPHSCHKRSVGFVRIRRTRKRPRPLMVDGLPCAPVARALADACLFIESWDEVRGRVADCVQQGRCSVEDLVHAVASAPRRDSGLFRRAVEEAVVGVRSWAEGKARDLIVRAGLPEPLWNVDLVAPSGEWLGRPDGWWGDAGVALQVDSREWHLSPDGWARSLRRQADLARLGIVTVPVTPRQLRDEPEEFISRLSESLAAGRLRGAVTVLSVEPPRT